ncbi:MAG TPA: DUF5715 family protein [Candidatus Paceibacterota bacterium]
MMEEARLAQTLLNHKNHLRRLKAAITNPIRATKKEKEEVREQTEVERSWWTEIKPYESLEEIASDFASEKLVRVKPNSDFKLIMRFANPELEDWQPYLRRDAASLLYEITKNWRVKMTNAELSRDIRLSVTSLVRTTNYQIKLIELGKLAMLDSAHTKGEAFDIDGCGYYDAEENINPRQNKNYRVLYNPLVHQLLQKTLEEMKLEGKLNFVLEYKGSTNQVFHIARSPRY